MDSHILRRRDFVKTFALYSACACVGGDKLRGLLLTPVKAQSTSQIGVFRISLDAFPALKVESGSVRLRVPAMPTSFAEIIVTRVAGNQFHAVTSRCTHQGATVSVYNAAVGALVCPLHGSRFRADGQVISGQATAPLTRYTTRFDGASMVEVDIPGLGFSATIGRVANAQLVGDRFRIEFPTVTGLRYEIRFRASAAGAEWIQVPFATTADGVVAQTVLNGSNTKAAVFVERRNEFGFFAVLRRNP